MRKLISLILSVVLILSCCIGVTADSTGLFRGINILPELMERPYTDYVRRDEFSAVASALMGFTKVEPAVTPFADVAGDNIYGSSIRTVKEGKIMNGVNSYEFAPGNTITFQDAIVTYVRILGYQVWADSKGGYPGGYNQVATSLKLFNEVSRPFDSMLTFGDLWALTDWALKAPTAEANYSMTNGVLTEEIVVNKNALTLLEKNLGYTMYEAFVDEVMGDTYSVNVTITEDDERGNAKYGEGDTLTLKAALTVNIAAYDMAPVYIWVSENDELIHIAMQDNCEVIYAPVYSINRDYSDKSEYNTEDITEIAFWDIDKEYEADEDGIAFYRNDEKVAGSIVLADKFVRAVIRDKKITTVETWDFKKGGIVSDITFKSISYKRGDITEAINDVDSFNKQILIIDGEMRDLKELKIDTLVDYYISPDKESFILLASEKKHTDIFESMTKEEIQLGNIQVKLSDSVYTDVGNTGYKEGNVSELIGSRVSAYIDAFGKVRYITTADVVNKDSFIGYLIGVRQGTGLDSNREIYVANIDDDTFEKKVYRLSDKLDEKEVTYDELVANQDLRNAKSIFRFKFNAKEEIVKVTKLSPYYGYETDEDGFVTYSTSGEFPGRGDPTYFAASADDKRIYVPIKERLVVLYETDGEAAFGSTNYDELTGNNPGSKVVFYFFGEEMSSEFDLILIAGDVSKMRGSSSANYGIVDSVRTTIGADGEYIKMAEIGGTKYLISDEDARLVAKNTLVYFRKLTGGFSKYDIEIRDTIQLAGDMNSWEGYTGPNGSITIYKGRVSKIDSKRIFFDDGSAFFFNPKGCSYKIYDEVSSSFEDGNSLDFLQDRDVLYVLTSNKIVSTIIYSN